MVNIFFISDTHFCHDNILTFTTLDGASQVTPTCECSLFGGVHQGNCPLGNFERGKCECTDGHAPKCPFKTVRLREFNSTEEMDETMVERWNKVVKPSDHIYHLGDVTMLRGSARKRAEPILNRLNGHKRLILGNHDHNPFKWYGQWFEKIVGSGVWFEGLLLSHYPVHPESIGKAKANVHGHIHEKVVLKSPHHPDPRYISVCVERLDYTPISLDELRTKLT